MRRATMLAVTVLALALFVNASADIPSTISYQAVLRDDTGTPVPDGTYDITFSLHLDPLAPLTIWSETQTVDAVGGIVNAHLGEVVSLASLSFMNPLWLGISIDGEPQLEPRTAFETVPYAAHAGTAGVALEGDDDWATDGDNVYRGLGNVGVGLPPADARLDVVAGDGIAGDFSNGSLPDPAVRVSNVGGTAGAFFSNTAPDSMPALPAAVYGRGEVGARGGHFSAGAAEGLYAESVDGNTALVAEAHGTGLAGQFLGGAGVQVENQAEVGGFKMSFGSMPGYVLTSDDEGFGTWEPAAGGSDADWTVFGSDMYATPLGSVGIGTAAPLAKLEVETADGIAALHVNQAGTNARAARITRATTPAPSDDMLQIFVPSDAPDDFQFIECERDSSVEFQVQGNGQVIAEGGALFNDDVEVQGRTIGSYYGDRVAEFTTTYTTGEPHVLHAECRDTGVGSDAIAVYGQAELDDDYGIGGYFKGGFRGVACYSQGIGNSPHFGLYARATGSNIYNYGVYAYADGLSSYAGYFNGDTHVVGTLSASTKAFKIDHPLDPANKYLLHSCVESDEMANVYSGNVTLDATGEARVVLPDWFEVLNGDFRYQLTCVGGFAPVYIAEKIEGNSFKVAGGDPGMEVSWQVTGVRRDAYAHEHRIAVEQDKPAHETGKSLHPELYGMPETASVSYHEDR